MSTPLTVSTSEPAPEASRPGAPARATALSGVIRTVGELAAVLDSLELATVRDLDRDLVTLDQVEREAAALGEPGLVMAARLGRADVLYHRGDTAAMLETVAEVQRWAREHDDRRLLAHSHRALVSVSHYLGDPAAALEHAIAAADLIAETTAPAGIQAFYQVKLADGLGFARSFEAARQRYLEAERMVVPLRDVEFHLRVLNNLAYTEFEAGEPERMCEVVERMLAVSAASRYPLRLVHMDIVVRARMSQGRHAEAERLLLDSMAEAPDAFEQFGLREECLLTLAEAQRRLGALERAQATLDTCRRACEDKGLAEIGVRLRAEQAELYAAGGEWRLAFEEYVSFHAETEELHAIEREAQARIRQVMFETGEARRKAELFREQALRDQLTGLSNRRFVDENLPALLERAALAGTPLIAALVDLDHFKRINDSLSHEVGDVVLATAAGLLAAAASARDDCLVARMGGEEFLVVFSATDPTECLNRLDAMRRAISSHDWRAITGDLPVTASFGVTVAQPGDDQSSLLARVDRNLYVAKDRGRNRVYADPGVVGPAS